jgi:hypothetical protein
VQFPFLLLNLQPIQNVFKNIPLNKVWYLFTKWHVFFPLTSLSAQFLCALMSLPHVLVTGVLGLKD